MTGAAARLRINERGVKRHRLVVATSIRAAGGSNEDFWLDSISAIGFSGRTERLFRAEDHVIVHLPVIGDMAARLTWVCDGAIAGEFARMVDADGMVAELAA